MDVPMTWDGETSQAPLSNGRASSSHHSNHGTVVDALHTIPFLREDSR